MPNHVHALFTAVEHTSLSSILHSWKSFTAKAANRALRREGQFWQEDYFDTYVRHESQFTAAVEYIEVNPVKAGLCAHPEDWSFGSAHLRAIGMFSGDAL